MAHIQVTVWNEYRHEKHNEVVAGIYPEGIHNAIAGYLKKEDTYEVKTAVLDDPDHGLDDVTLANTDVLIWWGHIAHQEVRDDIVEKVRSRVLDGMGLIVLHSGHASKIFERLLGTKTGALKWRDDGEKERIWVIEPGHPIAEGLGEYIEIPKEEMYGERFEIPAPDELVFISWFEGGEVFRSGCCYRRGQGKIFYFRPGHETFPVYHQPEVLKVISNAVRWAAPTQGPSITYGRVAPIENIGK
ncbi:trehalose utilization protein ThuA [Paenibacillus selenitireducens]|uniref:Trehalose utilization protein ThuA n=1 Tax=Paenibacillus selenitireducens TaxID=1324314 RepID=A0A1T2XKZ8_9BACL|nr:ThuA domain-containing protein [Paenibacillus selenitireducens]OPA80550.1 trehalose utilization protein ThuA [Paenibacillus selenitireducens]